VDWDFNRERGSLTTKGEISFVDNAVQVPEDIP
jgi:hypothetical protein